MIALSEEQWAASQRLEGPVRIIAGAGTGKTAVIADRYRRLVERGEGPDRILVMTFSERAAAEMRDRIREAAGVPDPPHVGTFHALALRWLREMGGNGLAAPSVRILSAPERWIVMRELMWELAVPSLIETERPDDLVTPLLRLQERLKQELIPFRAFAAAAHRMEEGERRDLLLGAARLFQVHAARCRRQRIVDFDDLLVEAVGRLESSPGTRARHAARFRWIMVDEYQDANLAQERIVELLGAPAGNVCVVGDDDQSIYRFRGASRAGLERFLAAFPGAATIALGRNRRSTGAIVTAARALISGNPGRIDKPIQPAPDAPSGEPVEVWRCEDGASEAAAVAEGVERLLGGGVALREIAVLTRTHAAAQPVVAALAAAGIPFQHWSGQGLLRRPEIQDLIAYLRLVADPADLHSLLRLASRPPLGLDQAAALALIRAEGAPSSPLQALAAAGPGAARWVAAVASVAELEASLGVDELLFEVMNRTRHLETAGEGPEGRQVIASVDRFAELVAEYCEHRTDHSLGNFVDHLRLLLLSGLDLELPVPEGMEAAVQVMSIHHAKGLEFDSVFVPALVDGRLPQPRRADRLEPPAELRTGGPAADGEHHPEERRLLYVAMTRARRRLFLSHSARYEGDRRWRPSRFLDELGATPLRLRAGPGEMAENAVEPATRPVASAAPSPLLSFSGISAYRECPRQYWYRYVLRLPGLPVVEAQFGTVVHEALLRAGRVRQRGPRVGARLLRSLYLEAWEGMVLAEPRRRPALEALGWRLLSGFHRAGGLEPRPHLLECSFTAELDGWTLRGVIDRVDPPEASGEAWRVIDYKSGRRAPASRLRRDLQLALYALGARASLGLAPLELEIFYLRDGSRVRLEAGQALLAEAAGAGQEVAAGIRAGAFEPRPDRRRCALCSYRTVCPSAL